MKTTQIKLINNQTWRPTTAIADVFAVHTDGLGARSACALPAHHFVGAASKKRHAAAMTATVMGPQPWSPPVT